MAPIEARPTAPVPVGSFFFCWRFVSSLALRGEVWWHLIVRGDVGNKSDLAFAGASMAPRGKRGCRAF